MTGHAKSIAATHRDHEHPHTYGRSRGQRVPELVRIRQVSANGSGRVRDQLPRVEMAKELLEHDANPAVTDAAGLTPLDLARQLRRADIVDLPQRAGARR